MEWLFLILISTIFLASRTIFTKKLLVNNDALPILFFVSLISTISMIFFYKIIDLNLSLLVYGLILLKSSVIAIAWFCIYQAYKNLEISIISPLKNLSPIFLIILSLIFLEEKISLINYIGIILLIISAYFLETKSFSKILEPLKLFKSKYFQLIIISLIGSSISAVLDKIITQSINYYSLMFIFYLFLTIIYLVSIIIKKDLKSLSIFSGTKNITLILVITFSALLADFLYFIAVAMPSTLIILIIPLRRLSTFISTLFGGKLFHEKYLLHKSIICLIMIFAVFLITQ